MQGSDGKELMEVVPTELHVAAILMLLLGFGSMAIVAVDVMRHPQRMWIMNVVWPVNALFATVLAIWIYFRYGRLSTRAQAEAAMQRGEAPPSRQRTPMSIMVAKGTGHCGSACTLGDIAAEWLAFAVPSVLAWFGLHSLFDEKIFATWALDFVFAFVIGIGFQYFTIVPMRHLGFVQGLWAAVKADAFSLTAWQVGMYGFMALANFWFFRQVLGTRLEITMPEFWFAMQLAMLCGFATSYPVNWWLIRKGWKEKM